MTNDTTALIRKLLTSPSSGTQPKDPKPAELTDKQTELLNRLIAHFSSPDFLPPERSTDAKPKDKSKVGLPLTEWEKCSLLNREALVRCLRADKWDLSKCQARIQETIAWRRDCGCDGIGIAEHADLIKAEAQAGKMFTLGFDNLGRPIVHMRPRYQSSATTNNRFPMAFWLIDRAIDLMPPGVESVLLLIDLAGPQESPSVKQQREFVRTLGAHYCERLGQALVVNVPTLFVWFLKLLKPVIDPVTFAKAVVDKADPLKFAPAEQLDACLGGTSGFEFDISTYWPVLVMECTRRREERLDNWIRSGKSIGASELADAVATSALPAPESSQSITCAATSPTDESFRTTASASVCSQVVIAPETSTVALVAVSQ